MSKFNANIIGKLLSSLGIRKAVDTNNPDVLMAIANASTHIISVVESLNETVVNEIKEASADGKLTKEEAIHIKDIAVDTVLELLSDDVKELISKTFGSIDTYIGNLIDKKVEEMKNKQ